MTNFGQAANAPLATRFRSLFKPRDIFLHDGKSLRRYTIGARLQMAAFAVAFFIFAWLAFATFQALAAMNSDVTRMQQQVTKMQADVAAMRVQTQHHAESLERRQEFLTRLLSGEADSEELRRLMPEQTHEPEGPTARAVAQPYAEIDDQQQVLAERAQAVTEQRYRQTAMMVQRLGLNPARFHAVEGGVGGPFEEVPADNADPQFRELFATWRQLEQLERGVVAIPSAHPIQASVNFTSGYGVRSDPFRGRAAMHAGIDLAGPYGTPIYATADGLVGRAEWNNGGYGNLVEINHGQGIQTRYGHMSRIIARAGQRVRRGDLIGLMGSTGRSTGSHLHYEVRIDGRAVNPIPFMRTNETLIALQRRTDPGTPITPNSVGGPAGGPSAGRR